MNERAYIKNKRKDPTEKANEIVNERIYIKTERQDPAFKAKELVNQHVSKQSARKKIFCIGMWKN